MPRRFVRIQVATCQRFRFRVVHVLAKNLNGLFPRRFVGLDWMAGATHNDNSILSFLRAQEGSCVQRVHRQGKSPIDDGDQRAGDETYGLQWLFLDVEFAVEPVEAEIEATRTF